MTLSNSYGHILKVALPIMFGSFVQFIVSFADVSFLGHLSDDPERTKLAVSGVGNAVLIYGWFFMLGQGLSQGVQILIARREGQKDYPQIGRLFRQSALAQFGLAVISFVIVMTILHGFIAETIESARIGGVMEEYLNTRAFGLFFTFLTFPFVALYVGTARTHVLIYITLVTALTNVFLDYALIFGEFGFERMEERGAALASAIAEGAGLFVAVAFTIGSRRKLMHYQLFEKMGIHKDVLVRMFKIGAPLMAQGLLAITGWIAFFFIIEKMGELEMASSQVVRSIYYLPLISLFGFMATTKTYVSNYLGDDRPDDVMPTIKRILILNLICCTVLAHGFVLYPEALTQLVTDDPSLIQPTAEVLRVVFGAVLMFALATVPFNVISGSGDTLAAFIIEACIIVVYLILCYLVVEVWNGSLVQVWCMEYMYFGCFIIVTLLYLRTGRWRRIKV